MLKTPVPKTLQRPLTWQDVLDDPALQDLPYKIELSERGVIEMSPATNLHSMLQGEIEFLVRSLVKTGRAFPKCSIETRKGVKVADVAWVSTAFVARHGYATPYPEAPELCVEIISPSNTAEAIREKIDLYLERGAAEVWTCDLDGRVSFYSASGTLEASALILDFPSTVTLD